MAVGSINNEIGQDQFLQLLVTQLRSQDPLDPVKNQEFIAQLAQFSTLEQIQKLNTSFSDLLTLMQLTQGTNLIGRMVRYQAGNSAEAVEATVQGFNLVDSRINLLANGVSVPLDNVLSVI